MVKIVELDDDVTAVGIGLAGSEVSAADTDARRWGRDVQRIGATDGSFRAPQPPPALFPASQRTYPFPRPRLFPPL